MIQRGMTHERTFAEILAPFRQSVAESGITDEELDALFRETIDEVRAEKRRKAP